MLSDGLVLHLAWNGMNLILVLREARLAGVAGMMRSGGGASLSRAIQASRTLPLLPAAGGGSDAAVRGGPMSASWT